MLSGFKQFILRGNVVDMAVGVVIGAAFATVVTAFTKDLLTPLIAAIAGKPDFSAITFTIHGSLFPIGDFINAAVSFLLVAAAVYFFVVTPINALVPNQRQKHYLIGSLSSVLRHRPRFYPVFGGDRTRVGPKFLLLQWHPDSGDSLSMFQKYSGMNLRTALT